MRKVIGIFLVRNEDRFVEQAIHNVTKFCDHILLVDHASSDETVSKLRVLQERDPQKFSFYQVDHPRVSHDLLKKFVGTDTWIFGVDGDEIYDTERLLSFRSRLLSGEFDHDWMIVGNVLHVDELNLEEGVASGYLAPPSRSITKLYNFAAITEWNGDTLERLHGGEPKFREGFHAQKKRLLKDEYRWEEAPLRCLHLCFIVRSSQDPSLARENIMELYAPQGIALLKTRLRSFFCKLWNKPTPSLWKKERYARGTRHTIEIDAFF